MILDYRTEYVEKKNENPWASMLVKKDWPSQRKKSLHTVTLVWVNQEGTKLTILRKVKIVFNRKLFLAVFDQRLRENMTGQKLALSGKWSWIVCSNKQLQGQKKLTSEWPDLHQRRIKRLLSWTCPNQYNILISDYNYLVVPDEAAHENELMTRCA